MLNNISFKEFDPNIIPDEIKATVDCKTEKEKGKEKTPKKLGSTKKNEMFSQTRG